MKWVLGLMSGTSLDGIDVGLLLTDGVGIRERGPHATYSYAPPLQACIHKAFGAMERTADIDRLEGDITEAHAAAVEAFWETFPEFRNQVELVGFHGQTITHIPPTTSAGKDARGWTWQLGDGALLARLLNIPVVFDFRTHDMLHGGHGAPLVPIYHQALCAAWLDTYAPILCINIGGVANATYVSPEAFLAFDVGPGGALLDDWMHRHAGISYDPEGVYAGRGQVQTTLVQNWCADSFFNLPLPKSLDRNHFAFVHRDLEGLSVEDGAATLTAWTVASILLALDHMPEEPQLVCLMGGGRHNTTLYHMLEEALRRRAPQTVLARVEDVPHPLGPLSGDSLEAEAFAYLAARQVRHLPISFPLTTGVPTPLCGGTYVGPDGRFILPRCDLPPCGARAWDDSLHDSCCF